MREKTLLLLENKKYSELRELLEHTNRADLALLIDELPKEEAIIVFRILPKELAAETFVYMDGDTQEHLITALTDIEVEEVMSKLNLDDTVDIIEEMPAIVVKRILRNTEAPMRNLINEFLKYPEDSAGSIMTIEFVDLKKDMTVEQAFSRIRMIALNKETVYTCYVLDDKRKLIGIVTVKDLLLAEKSDLINDIMETNIIYANTLQDRELIVKQFDKYDLLAIPVVDQEHRLVGIITVDDAMDVMQQENTEDFAIMAAMSPAEDSYFKTPVWKHAKNRIMWLLILMLSATVTGTIITKYENAFAAIPLLVAFIPMLMDTGGNCGSQSSTLIIRGLALDEIHMRDFFKVLWKESRVALLVGTVLAIVNGLRILIQYQDSKMAIVVGLALFGTVLMAKIIGGILPMIAKKFRLDPAIMAAPIITTIVDTGAVLLYFSIAMKIMNIPAV